MRGRIGIALLGALAPLSVLAVDPAGWFPFGPGKWLVLSVLLPAGAAAVLAAQPLRVPRALAVALAALVVAMGAAALVGLDPRYAWTGTPERHFGVLTWALAALALAVGCSLDPARHAGPLCAGLVVAALGTGAVATAEALGWEPAVLDVGSRLTGPFGSSAYLGAATALLLPAMVGLALEGRAGPVVRGAAALSVPLLAVACLGSGARAAWVGLSAALVVALVARRGRLRGHGRALGGLALLGLVAAGVLLTVTPAGDRIASVTDPDEPGGRGRLDEWRVAARVVADHPLTGVGPEGYRAAFATAVDARYERAHGRDPHPDRAHAGPLDVALAGGLPGLAAWAAVVALVGRHVLRALRSGPPWLTGIAAGLVAHLAGQLLLFPVVELELVAWLVAGLVVAAVASPGEPSRRVPRGVPMALATLALVALVAGVAFVAADRHAEQAARALSRGDGAAAVRSAEAAVALRPDVVRNRVLAARALLLDRRGTLAAIEELEAALEVSPDDPIVRRERVAVLVARAAATQVPAHVEAARAELDRMLARDPNDTATWRQAELLAAVDGDEASAREARRRWQALVPVGRRTP